MITNTPVLSCENCQTNYTSVRLDEKAYCLKFGDKARLSLASSVCAKDGARLPLPKNAKENADLLMFFNSKRDRSQQNFALDLNDVKIEGEFVNSLGRKINFTNWQVNEPDNKNNSQDYVTMWNDGLWNDYDGNHSASAIICLHDCPQDSSSITTSSPKLNINSTGTFCLKLFKDYII